MAAVAVKSANAPKGGTVKKSPVSSKSKPHLPQPIDSPVNQILYLQRTIGNRAVTRLIQSGTLQAKLRVGPPNDIYEQEADRVADQVMRMPEGEFAPAPASSPHPKKQEEIQTRSSIQLQPKPLAQQITPLVQRQEEEDKKKSIQSKRSPGQTPDVTPDIESNINAMKGGGQSLSKSTLSFFEPRFGVDFSQVRVHADSRAAQTAQAINAKAFTTGKDIVFNSGQYSTDTSSGNRLLAHELTHVVQQVNLGNIGRQMGNILMRQANLLPSWNWRQLTKIQYQLRRLGLYWLKIDGILGKGTEYGLVEAFGGDEWRSLTPIQVINRLKVAKRPKGKRGEHAPRYGQMFKDGILDVTLGMGFEEGTWHLGEIKEVVKVLKGKGFVESSKDAKKLLKKMAGRTLGASAYGLFFVKKKAIAYKPPASKMRWVHVVVRFVKNERGSGKKAAKAFMEGMTQSDVAAYSGHARYGSGPDFDRNMRYELLDRNGKVTHRIDDYKDLEEKLKNEGKPRRTAWQQFKWRLKRKRIKVIGYNEGNIFLNPRKPYKRSFGAKLMYWNLKRKGGKGATVITGRRGRLARAAKMNLDRKYRFWIFNGCITNSYVKSIRGTPGYGSYSTDIAATRRVTYWHHYAEVLIAALDSIIKMQSAEQVIKNANTELTTGSGAALKGYGLKDNPKYR
jgi:hypothetical protein